MQQGRKYNSSECNNRAVQCIISENETSKELIDNAIPKNATIEEIIQL